jgi:gluconate 2-dehydrogenase subunit 3-like protein
VKRREMVELLALAPLAAAFHWAPHDVSRAVSRVRATAQRPELRFFTAHEWDTVRILVDLVIPRDDRSGSATEAGVPEFMDFIVSESTGMQTPMRGGLAWIDLECRRRYTKTFLDASDAERRLVLDDIAWPARAKPEHAAGAAFFTSFRDLTASGFFSSKMGVADVGYIGNVPVPDWRGCPPEALSKLGVKYDA